jgi:leucyl/phenylalanyl-tRNA---protein transferase
MASPRRSREDRADGGKKKSPMFGAFKPQYADEQGLVAIGGDLDPETLLKAYRSGVFPWFDECMPVCWWSPDPRAIIDFDKFHVSRSLARTIRSGQFDVTFNRDFEGVMRGCSIRDEGTWITPSMLRAYLTMHSLGHVHSVETWQDGKLVGGAYGVAIGGFFAGESMFHRVTDASKVALATLLEHLQKRGFALFDTQFITPHTSRMGATEIPRAEYLKRLKQALAVSTSFSDS